MLNDDIEIAQRIVGNSVSNITNMPYHNSSAIYTATNEKINNYQCLLRDRKKTLSVISSGDQILNTVLEGSINIDGYDISRFPKYFLELKRASVMTLDLDEFIEFFYKVDYHKNETYDDLYFEQIRLDLDEPYRKFWDGLFNFFDWSEIYNSTLFSKQGISLDTIIQNNEYLELDNYIKLRELLKIANLNYYTGDIFDLVNRLKQEYDFINLSSIIYYVKRYNKILERLPLEQDGGALTYLYNVNKQFKLGYPNCQIIQFDNCPEGIMLYKKYNKKKEL